ncbi:MAG: SGNH/GDSL hydrolase family protein [Anaerolineae bacterium]
MDKTLYWFVFFTLAGLVVSLALNVAWFFRAGWKNPGSRWRRAAQNLALLIFTGLVTLLLLELFFKLFFAQSDGFNYTLASKNWFEWYWRKNSLDYRDIEWTPEMVEGRTKVMVLGDSFVAGYGIENEADRFSNLLGQQLGADYAVMNVGQLGASTKDEIENALQYPYPPDIVILSFYLNDIMDTAQDLGFKRPPAQTHGPFPVDYSYALNFLYWRVYRLGPQEWNNDYWTWLLSLYQKPEVWQLYRQQLLQIADYVQQRQGRLIVVVFPNLMAVEESRPVTAQVSRLFAERGVPVLDVTDLVARRPAAELIASPVDSHPNELVHRLVAERLYPLVLHSQPLSQK